MTEPVRPAPRRRAAALVAALLLAGCTSLAPRHERPAAPVAAAFPGDTGTATGTPAVERAWPEVFGDARLRRLVELALANNRDLRIAALNVEQARAQLGLRRADRLPTVGLGASLTRQPSADPDDSGNTSLYTVGLSVTAWEIDLFGRLRNLSDAAAAQLLASAETRNAVQASLVAAVANTYLALLADEALLQVSRDTLATRQESYRLTRLRFEHGASSEIDFRLAESLLEAARVALAQQTRQRMLDENALVLLVGQPLPADLPTGLPVSDPQMVADVPAGIPSEVLVRRPDVQAAEQQLAAASANIGAARAAFFPRITLTGSAGTASRELSGLFQSGSFAWTFVPQLLLPIFDAGRNAANLELATVNRDIAVAQYERTVQTAFREVADALAGRATLAEQLRAQQAVAEAEGVRTRLAQLRYDNGVSSFLDVLDAQRSLFAARQAVVQVQAQQAQALVNLYQALGGGWRP